MVTETIEQQLEKREKELKKKNHDLTERLKEINCLYKIGSIIQNYNKIDEVIELSVKEIPQGWHYPDITVSRIIFEGKNYVSKNFLETEWKQYTDIIIDGEKIGVIEVYYLEEKPELDEGPFLKEERNLINSIAVILGSAIERLIKKDELQAAYHKLLTNEQELKASNQQLQASEQQLRAYNQQLVAIEQQLRATNQQLQASEQQLTASNQQLEAKEQQLRLINQELMEHEENYRKLFENSPSGIVICKILRDSENNKIDFIHLQANKSTSIHTGFDISNLVNVKASELLDDKALHRLLNIYGEVVDKQVAKEYEEYFEVYDKTLSVRTYPIKDDIFIINFQDVSVLKKLQYNLTEKNKSLETSNQHLYASEQQLRAYNQQLLAIEQQLKAANQQFTLESSRLTQSEEKFRTVMEKSPLPMWISDKQGTILHSNEALKSKLNVTDEQLIGKYNIFEDENLKKQNKDSFINSVFRDLKTVRFEMEWNSEYAHNAGFHVKKILWIDVILYPLLDKDGILQNVVCSWIDKTLEKESKLFAEKIAETTPAMLYIYDTEKGENIWVNDAHKLYFRDLVKDSPDMHFDSLSDIIHPDDSRAIVNLNLLMTNNSNFNKYNLDIRVKSIDDDWRWMNLFVSSFKRDEKGHLLQTIGALFDITYRKNTELELKNTLDATTDGIWTWNFKTGALSFSPKYYRMLGYRPNEFDANFVNWANLIHPDDKDHAIKTAENFLEKQTDKYENEFRMITKDGSYKWIQATAKVVKRDNNGKALYLIGNHKDITQSKQDEEALKENQKRLAASQEMGLIGTWTLDIVNDVLEWTEQNYRNFGIEPGKFIRVADFFDLVHPDDQEFVNQQWNSAMNGAPYDIEHRIIVDGKVKWVREKAEVIFDENGSATNAIGITQDITDKVRAADELKQQKNFIELIINSATTRIFWKDLNSVYLGCNKAFAQDAGLEKPEDIIGKTDNDLIWKFDAEKYCLDDKQEITTGQPKNGYEEEFINKDGKKVVWRTNKQPLINSNGKILGLVATAENITIEKEIENKIKQSEEKLKNIIENSTNLFYIHSKEGVLSFISPQIEKFLGYNSEEVFKHWSDFITDNPINEKAIEYTQRALETGVRQPAYELEMLKKNGDRILVEVRESPVVKDGKVTSIVGSMTDITARKQAEDKLKASEERFQIAMNASSDGLFDWNLVTNEIYYSPGWKKLIGYQDHELPNDFSIWENLTAPDDVKKSWEMQRKVINKEIDRFVMKFKMKHKDGHWVDILSRAAALFNNEGEAVRFVGTHVDITELTLSKEKLKVSEERYRELVDTVNSGVAIYKVVNEGKTGSDYIIQDFNQFALEHENKCKEEVIGKSLKDIRPNIDEYGLIDIFRKVWESGESTYFPAKVYVDDNFANYYENRVFRLPSGEIVAIYDDVTAREATRLELAESEKKFRLLYNESPDMYVSFSPEEATILMCNETLLNKTGYSRNEIIGSEIFKIYHESCMEDAHNSFQQFLKKGVVKNRELIIKKKNGEQIYVILDAKSIRDEDGKIQYSISSWRDITDKKKAEDELSLSEQKFRRVYDHMKIGIAFVSLDFRIMQANPSYCQMLGYDESELIGKHLKDITQIDSLPENLLRQRKLRAGEIEHYQMEKAFIHKNGHTVLGIVDANLIRDINNEPLYFIGSVVDITERKKALEKLHETQLFADKIAETTPTMLYIYDYEMQKNIWTNQFYKNYFNTLMNNNSEISINNVADIIFQEDLVKVLEMSDAMTINPEFNKFILDVRIKSVDDDCKWMTLIVKSFLRDEKGKLLQAIGALFDITDRKKAEHALTESERRLLLATKSAGIGIWDWDIISNKMIWDDRIFQMYGITEPPELISLEYWRNCIHPEDRETAAEHCMAALRGEKDYNIEFRVLWADGTIRWLKADGVVISNDNGKPVRMYGTNYDITERKIAEEEIKRKERDLRSLVENPAGYVIYRHRFNRETGEFEVVQVSPSFTEVLGIQEEHQSNFERWFSFVHPEDLPAMKKANEKGMEPPFKLSMEIRYNHPDKGLRWFEIRSNGIPYEDDPDKIEFGNGIILDITARKKAENELIKMEKLRSIGTLAGGIAHDFNNILTVIYGNVSLMKTLKYNSEANYEMLTDIESSISRAKKLSNQLLTFSKGGSPIKKEVNITNLLKETISFDLSGSQLKPVFDFTDEVHWAKVDEGQMQQVFSNLSINAIQASSVGSHFYVSINKCSIGENEVINLESGEYLKITIKDKGKGISKENLNRIFDPYFTTKETGNGLGLATVYSIIKKHRGTVKVDSELGKGSVFTIYLPASGASNVETRENTDQPGSNILQVNKSKRILIMDDEEAICKLLFRFITHLGYDCEKCFNGEQAIAMYKESIEQQNPFDLIIMDLTIPGGMGGKETLKKMLEVNSNAKVLVSSGYSGDSAIAEYKALGFLDVLNKPYTLKKIEGMLKKFL